MKETTADPMTATNRGFYVWPGLSDLFVALSTYLMMGEVWYYFFGVVATMDMLMTAAYTLAMDTFGLIAHKAGGIV